MFGRDNREIAVVFLGGAIGTLARAGLAVAAVPDPGRWPWPTFVANIVGAVLLGMLSGIGGGIARDLLVAEVPNVLRREFYAVAALLGAMCVVAGDALGFPATPTAIVGALTCFVLRYLAIRRNWQLPVARSRNDR